MNIVTVLNCFWDLLQRREVRDNFFLLIALWCNKIVLDNKLNKQFQIMERQINSFTHNILGTCGNLDERNFSGVAKSTFEFFRF